MDGKQSQDSRNVRELPQCAYDREYFEKHCGSFPYRWDISQWPKFFGDVAEALNQSLKLCTVLDVGCAVGFLVDAFWRRGVRAYGIDISEYAISQVPQDVRSFCRVLSAADPLPDDFPQTYDLITCIEVLEHVPQEEARTAIKKMASRTSCILFSSTPHDLTEPTHVNVRPVIYWLQLFAEVGFYPDLRFDAGFVCPQAFLVRKGTSRLEEDALPFFSESIHKKFQIQAQLEQIAALTRSNQDLEGRLGDELRKRDREVENLRQEFARLSDHQRERLQVLKKDSLLLRSQVQQLQETAGQKEIHINHVNAERDHLRTALSQTGADLIEAKRSEAELRGERDRLQRTLADQETGFGELRQLFEREVSQRDSKIDSLQVTQSGLLWEAFVFYRNAKDRYFPPRTKRRALYDYGLQTLKTAMCRLRLSRVFVLIARHPARTLKNLNRVNVDKFFYHMQHSDPAVLEAKLERKLGLNQPVSLPVTTRLQKFVLIISGCPGDAFRYRCEHQAEQLRFLGLTVDITFSDQVEYREVLDNYRCYWLHRVPHTPIVEDFIRGAQEMGKPVIFDTDDLIFDEEKISYIRALQWMTQDEVTLYYDGVRRYHRTLSLCRFATVTTEPLREAIQRHCPQIQCFVNPNALSDAQVAQADEALRLSRPAEDENIVRIAYLSGTRTHNIDFQECSGALKRVLETHPHVRLMLVGHLDLESQFERFGDRLERYPLLPWQQLPSLLRKVDINLAPLELDNPFTESKSALKYFEAAVMGVPTVASDVRAYSGSVRHGENGFLCRTEEDWFNCLTRLVEDADLRRRHGQQARTIALKALTTRRQVLNLKSVLNEICQASVLTCSKTLSIAFVLRAPIAQVGGGYKVIFHLAHYLARRRHEVHLYVEPIAHLEGKTEAEIIEFCHSYFGASQAQIHVGHDLIQPSDIAIATNWPTAFIVDALVNTRCKAYLIQDYEPDFYETKDPLREEVEKTYKLSLRKVCIGRYLAGLFTDRDRLPAAVFDFPLDHEIFHGVGRKTAGPIRLLFFARPALQRRGYSIGLEALDSIHRERSDVQIYLYGMEETPGLSFPYTNLGVLDQQQLAQAMRDADIHLSFSLSNISQVPFQAMACGCAVVETNVPSVAAVVENGRHCLLAEPQPNAVAAALHRLIEDGDLRSRIAKAGMEFVCAKTWENSCEQFEDVLYDSLLMTWGTTDEESIPRRLGFSPDFAGQTGERSPNGVLTWDDHRTGIYYRSCNFCGGTAFRIFKRLDVAFPDRIYGDQELAFPAIGKHLKLQYLECSQCGLIGINPLTRFNDINRSRFDGERNIVAWADLDYSWYEADKLKEIRLVYEQYEFEKYRQTNRVLDVSCGPGVSLKWLRDEKGWKVFGIDPDQHSIRMAWDRYGVRIENGLIHDLAVPDEYFDIIIMDNSLEHTFDPNSTLLRAFKLLRTGGGVFIYVPNSHGLSTKYLNANAYWGHWFLYSPKALHNFLSAIGFRVTKINAVQESVDQAIIDRGYNIEPYRVGLRVSLGDEIAVAAQIGNASMYSDYFNLMAIRPTGGGVSAERETKLLSIAQSSLEQRGDVTIDGRPTD